MPQVRVDLNLAGMRQLMHHPAVAAKVHDVAEAVAADARRLITSEGHVQSGDYLASVHVEDDVEASGRARSRAVADDWKAPILEARYKTMTRAADAGRAVR